MLQYGRRNTSFQMMETIPLPDKATAKHLSAFKYLFLHPVHTALVFSYVVQLNFKEHGIRKTGITGYKNERIVAGIGSRTQKTARSTKCVNRRACLRHCRRSVVGRGHRC